MSQVIPFPTLEERQVRRLVALAESRPAVAAEGVRLTLAHLVALGAPKADAAAALRAIMPETMPADLLDEALA